MMTQLAFPKAGKVRVRKDGSFIIVESDVKMWPWQAALEVAKEITRQAREIEADMNAGRIINDQAMLIRLGIPIGLTDNPAFLEEAKKHSMYDPQLRRYISGSKVKGIKSAERIGTPSLIQGKPKGGKDG